MRQELLKTQKIQDIGDLSGSPTRNDDSKTFSSMAIDTRQKMREALPVCDQEEVVKDDNRKKQYGSYQKFLTSDSFNEKNIFHLRELCEYGEAYQVKEVMSHFSLDLSDYSHVSLLKKLIQYHPDIAGDILNLKELDLSTRYHIDLLEQFIYRKHISIVVNYLRECDIPFSNDSIDLVWLMLQLAEHDEALFVAEKMVDFKFNLDASVHVDILQAMLSGGEEVFVLNKIEEAFPVHIDDSRQTHLYARAIKMNVEKDNVEEHRAQEYDPEVIGTEDILDLDETHHINLMEAFICSGQAEIALENMDLSRFDLVEDAHRQLLTVMIAHLNYDTLIYIIDTISFEKCTHSVRLWMYEKLIERREFEEYVVNKLSVEAIDNVDQFTFRIIKYLCENKKQEILLPILDKVKFDISNGDTLYLIAYFARNGYWDLAQRYYSRAINDVDNQNTINDEDKYHKACDEDVFENEIEFVTQAYDDVRRKNINSIKEVYRSEFFNTTDHVNSEIIDEYLNIVETMSSTEVQFLENAIKASGRFSVQVARYLDFVRGNKAKFVLPIEKTGSHLYIYGERNSKNDEDVNIAFVNDVWKEQALIWKELNDEGVIPVAPIVADLKDQEKDVSRVYSRYCGIRVDEVMSVGTQELRKNVYTKFLHILHDIEQKGYDHGHPHLGNFTVEFIERDYLNEHLAQGGTLNDVPYKKSKFVFDLVDYLEGHERYIPIVRMIDLDSIHKIEN